MEELPQKQPSHLISFFRYIFKIYPAYKGDAMTYGLTEYGDDKASFTWDMFKEIEWSRSWIFIKSNKSSKLLNYQLNYALSYIKKIKSVCIYKNIKLLFVLIPDELQINTDLQTDLIKSFRDLTSENFDFMLPNTLLCKELEKLNIEYLDLLHDFVIASKKQRYYKPNDTHWNIAGNKLAADLIYNRIKNMVY